MRSLSLFILIIFIPCLVKAQQEIVNSSDTVCAQKDIADVIRGALNKPPKVTAENAGSLLLIPIIGSNPATGFMLGLGIQYGFKMPGAGTRYSMISGSLQFTSKNQKIFVLKNN